MSKTLSAKEIAECPLAVIHWFLGCTYLDHGMDRAVITFINNDNQFEIHEDLELETPRNK